MDSIESKYFIYYKPCRIVCPCTKTVPNRNIKESSNFMKTNTLNAMLAVATLGIVTLIAASRGAAGHFELLPILVSYIAVAILASLAASDYRVGAKPYSVR